MKFIVFGLLLSAVLIFAQDGKEEIKVYKRLIPADVLRGECVCVYFVNMQIVRVRKWRIILLTTSHWSSLKRQASEIWKYDNHVHYWRLNCATMRGRWQISLNVIWFNLSQFKFYTMKDKLCSYDNQEIFMLQNYQRDYFCCNL
jgi:hypothetical protein